MNDAASETGAHHHAADTAAPSSGVRRNRPAVWIERFEWLGALLVTVFAVALHIRFVTNVGGLWRDETNSVNLATLPSLGEMWRFLDYDSFPVFYFLVLRGWTGIFGAGDDAVLRALGLIIGLGVLGVLWANARAFGARVPVLSIALLGLNPMFIRYGDSNRAYGLGIILILLTLRSFWRLVEQPSGPSGKRIAAATALALLSVHCLYYNSVLLLAIAAGALAVAMRARAWRTAGIILAIGGFSAVTLLPYVPMMNRMREWTFLVNYPCDFHWLWTRASEVMGSPLAATVWLWTGLSVGGLLLVAGYGFWSLVARKSTPLASPVLFAAITLGLGVTGYAGFLRMLNYYTQPWYYITLAAFAACSLDIVFGAWPVTSNRKIVPVLLRCIRPVVALALLCLVAQKVWKEMPTRHTNVDLVAAEIQRHSKEGDLILFLNWESAVTFCWYYHGPAEVITVPMIEDHRFHRYDLILKELKKSNGQQPVLAKIEATLRAGQRVFCVGKLPPFAASLPAVQEPPIRRNEHGKWQGIATNHYWKLEIGQFLRAHSLRSGSIPVPVEGEVQKFENLTASVLEGWR